VFIYPARPLHSSNMVGSESAVLCVLLLFLIYLFLKQFLLGQLSQIYKTDLCQIFGVGRIAVDDQSEIGFSSPQGALLRQPFFVGFVDTTVPVTFGRLH